MKGTPSLRIASGALLAALALAALAAAPGAVAAPELVRTVRLKLSAGDLASAEAAVEEYRRTVGIDRELLNAVGWLARGAEMLGRRDVAAAHVAELRREIPVETPERTIALGAAIEVEGKLRAFREGRGSAIRFLEGELAIARDPALRARIRKNLNLLSLEGSPAPAIATGAFAGPLAPPRLADLAGRPVLLFFWAPWCGDCKDQGGSLARVAAKYASRGLAVVAPTRLYGTAAEGKPAAPEVEAAWIAKVWAESFPGLEKVSVPVDGEAMERYGASATPTFVLVDRKGTVRLYTPTRLTEAELSRRIEELLAEPG